MAVQVDAKDIQNASPDVKARNPQLYAKGGAANQPAQKPVKKTTPTKKAPVRQPKQAPPTRRQRVQRVASQRVQRVATQHANRVSGGLGAVFVLLTGAGIAFAIMKNPALITAPLSFITTIVQKMTSFGNSTPPMRTIPVPSGGGNNK